MKRAVPDVAYTTMGQSSLSDLALDKPYRWRKTPGWTPASVRFREAPRRVPNPRGGTPPDSTARKALLREEESRDG